MARLLRSHHLRRRAVASSIDARAGRNARTSPAGAVRGDLDCDDIQERAVHGGQEVTMQLGEKKMATFIREDTCTV